MYGHQIYNTYKSRDIRERHQPEEPNPGAISAYLASELGDLLLNYITCSKENIKQTTKIEWVCESTKYDYSAYAETLAEAMGLMLIYLIENHLISVEELGK